MSELRKASPPAVRTTSADTANVISNDHLIHKARITLTYLQFWRETATISDGSNSPKQMRPRSGDSSSRNSVSVEYLGPTIALMCSLSHYFQRL